MPVLEPRGEDYTVARLSKAVSTWEYRDAWGNRRSGVSRIVICPACGKRGAGTLTEGAVAGPAGPVAQQARKLHVTHHIVRVRRDGLAWNTERPDLTCETEVVSLELVWAGIALVQIADVMRWIASQPGKAS